MKLLKDKIIEEGKVISDTKLDVSSFLNHQVDPELMKALGEDFAEVYKDYDFDAFVTVETSGIAPSLFASLYSEKPLVIIKKEDHLKDESVYSQQESYSFTKDHEYYLTVKKEFIENKKVILIDDFLAKGSVAVNCDKLIKQANSELVAIGICISKNYQEGYKKLREDGYDLYIQAELESLDPETNSIKFSK